SDGVQLHVPLFVVLAFGAQRFQDLFEVRVLGQLPQPRNDGTTLPVLLHGWLEWASAREQLIRKRRSKLLVRMADADVNQRIVGRPCAENDHEHGAVRYAGPQTSLRWLAGVVSSPPAPAVARGGPRPSAKAPWDAP